MMLNLEIAKSCEMLAVQIQVPMVNIKV